MLCWRPSSICNLYCCSFWKCWRPSSLTHCDICAHLALPICIMNNHMWRRTMHSQDCARGCWTMINNEPVLFSMLDEGKVDGCIHNKITSSSYNIHFCKWTAYNYFLVQFKDKLVDPLESTHHSNVPFIWSQSSKIFLVHLLHQNKHKETC